MPIIKSPTKIITVLIIEFGENRQDITSPVPAGQDSFSYFPNLKQFVE